MVINKNIWIFSFLIMNVFVFAAEQNPKILMTKYRNLVRKAKGEDRFKNCNKENSLQEMKGASANRLSFIYEFAQRSEIGGMFIPFEQSFLDDAEISKELAKRLSHPEFAIRAACLQNKYGEGRPYQYDILADSSNEAFLTIYHNLILNVGDTVPFMIITEYSFFCRALAVLDRLSRHPQYKNNELIINAFEKISSGLDQAYPLLNKMIEENEDETKTN
jgi:hypothetical protein